MGLRKQIGVGAAVLTVAAAGALGAGIGPPGASAQAAGAPAPLTGDWEGTGPHGLPLSFSLARRHGQLIATSATLGAPSVCPANQRDAKAVALGDVAYTGPGGSSMAGSSSSVALLSGVIPGRRGRAVLTGAFATPRAGRFSVPIKSNVACGWPQQTLTWSVRASRRRPVRDGRWTARLSGAGITAGAVTLVVTGAGRVIESFAASFRCETPTDVGDNKLDATPAYEFIRPDGSFYSPLVGNAIKGHPTLWSGQFARGQNLTGRLTMYDSCTRQLVQASFRGALAKPAQGAGATST